MCAVFRPLSKLPTSTLTNEVILCLVRFGFDRNKLMQLLIRSQNSGGRTGRSLVYRLAAGCTTGWTNYVNELSQRAQPSGPAIAWASSSSLTKKKLNHHTLATCKMTQFARIRPNVRLGNMWLFGRSLVELRQTFGVICSFACAAISRKHVAFGDSGCNDG